MRRIAIAAMVLLAAPAARPARVLWAGMDGNAVVGTRTDAVPVTDWALELISGHGVDPFDVGGRIRVGGEPQPAGYEDPSGYIPPGQTAPSVLFEDGITDFCLLILDSNDDWTGGWADWTPVLLTDTDRSKTVSYDIGYFRETSTGEWELAVLATVETTLGAIWEAHTYETGTLAPPTETPWRPLEFRSPDAPGVPEPSATALGILGAALLLHRRRRP